MNELSISFIVYGYVLPLLVMLAWMVWRICSERKQGERFVLHYVRDWWPFLLPGVALWGACALLMLATVEGSWWLERHWEPWRTAGEQSRRIWRWMFGKIMED